MKDKVFIAWSGSRTVAAEVCRKLMKEDFLCLVGGNDQNEVQAVGNAEAVVAQMKECNQAIVIFQNRDKEGISGNLFFELGYVFAVYGAEKCTVYAAGAMRSGCRPIWTMPLSSRWMTRPKRSLSTALSNIFLNGRR